jgi:nucleotide-binding universal stress UspA family protein
MATMQPTIARILVPTDYSATADHALAWAVLHGRTFAAEVVVLHVLPSHRHFGALGYADRSEAGDLTKDREHLAAHVAAHLGDSGVTVRTLVEVGEPPLKIREVAQRERVDLIIMGTHGVSRLEDLIFGSVTEKVVHHTGCPVLVVPPRSEAEAEAEAD